MCNMINNNNNFIVVDTKHLFDYFIINEKPRNALGMKARQ